MMLKRKTEGHRINESELEKLIDMHQVSLVKSAFYMTGSMHEAEDIVQDVFVKFYFQSQALNDASKTKAYLYKMVHNACIDFIRKARQNKVISLDKLKSLPDERLNGSKKKVMLQNEFQRISKLLAQILVEQAEVIRMRTIDDLSFVEIARILEIPVTTVKSRFIYGINKLRQRTEIKKEVYDEL